ncbi:hypothetical protein [Streptomyces sp. NPDC056527]|uniref:hypothetical protein n=1 Tax=Streptomyces sp. NPDC056527 TaxID=3345853 RepID=UPI0036BFCD1F
MFHSEADLQHGFARVLWELAPGIQSRLEVRQPLAETDGAEHLDLMCIGPSARTAVEFKYFKARWAGVAGPLEEEYALASHAATDLGRLGFVSDIVRLERFCTHPDQNGLALLLTNDRALWTPPKDGARRTRDADFRIHEGRTLTGELLWGEGDYAPNTRTLQDTYRLSWEDYSRQEGPRGEFRYMATWVGGA